VLFPVVELASERRGSLGCHTVPRLQWKRGSPLAPVVVVGEEGQAS